MSPFLSRTWGPTKALCQLGAYIISSSTTISSNIINSTSHCHLSHCQSAIQSMPTNQSRGSDLMSRGVSTSANQSISTNQSRGSNVMSNQRISHCQSANQSMSTNQSISTNH
jgi:hypothetical protein